MFDVERFVADCCAAASADPTHKSVREVVARAVSDPAAVLGGLGEPTRAEIRTLHRADNLTVLNVIWGPGMAIMPHNHQMWAVIGVYTGREDNIFWRRIKDAEPLSRDIVHSVLNPIPRLTGAIHVYGGDFFAAERSEWDPETLTEQRYDVARAMKLFEDANAR